MSRRKNSSMTIYSSDEDETYHQEATTHVRWRRSKYECSRCGYVSERKSNVERHYKRIHCELRKHKKCVCDQVFKTKGEYYEHCNSVHPYLRNSWFITTEKYKIGKFKPKAANTDSVDDHGHKAMKHSGRRGVRFSPRLLSLYKKTGYKKDVIVNDIPKNCDSSKSLNHFNSTNDKNQALCVMLSDETSNKSSQELCSSVEPRKGCNSSVELAKDLRSNVELSDKLNKDIEPQEKVNNSVEFIEEVVNNVELIEGLNSYIESTQNSGIAKEPLTISTSENILEDVDKENFIPIVECNFHVVREEIVFSANSILADSQVPNINSVSSSTHLPLKKRFGKFPMRKSLSDITNFVNNRPNEEVSVKCLRGNSEHVSSNQMHAGNNFTTINDEYRAFMNQIDFDELDAILSLKNLKKIVN